MLALYIVEVCFFLFTVPLYIFVLISMWRSWNMETSSTALPFFQLCFLTGVIDIVTMINNNLGNVLPKACVARNLYLSLGTPYLHLYFFIAWSAGGCQCISVLVIALNRLTSLISDSQAAWFWHTKWIYLVFAVQVVPGLAMGTATTFVTVGWDLRENSCSIVGSIQNRNVTRVYFKIASVFLLSTALAIICIYGYIFFFIRNTHRQLQTHKAVARLQTRRESKLLLMSACICGIQVCYTLYIVLREIFSFDQNYTGFNFFSDICAGINPYLLLIFSRSVRSAANNMFWKYTNSVPTVVRVGGSTGVAKSIPSIRISHHK